MAIASDFSVDRATGNIRHTSGATTYTVLEMHRYLQTLADDAAAAGDDELDITDVTPSERATDNIITLINGYNIDDTAATFLYDGSITQGTGTTETTYAGLVVVGSLASGNLEIIQDNVNITDYWTTALNANATANIIMRCLVKTRANGVDIDGTRIRVQSRTYSYTYDEFSVTMGAGNNVAAISTVTDLNNQTASGTVAAWTITNTEGYQGLDVNADTTNEFYYSQWDPGSQSINDLYERTKYIQRDGTAVTIGGMNGSLFRGITTQWNYDGEAGTGPTDNDTYAWGLKFDYQTEVGGPFTVGEALVFGTSNAKGRLLALDDNGTTGSMVVSVESGTPATTNTITGQTSGATAAVNGAPTGQATGGGTAQFLAVLDSGTTGTVWTQILKGTAPADNAICYELLDHANMITVNGSTTARTVSKVSFLGQSTGSAVIGAFGIGIKPSELSASDILTDLTGATITPPNNVTFTVSGLVSGDRVFVAPWDGSTYDAAGFPVPQTTQMLLNTSLVGATETSVVVTTSIPTDTPSTGTIRVVNDDGYEVRLPYTSWTGSTFTITSADFSGNNETESATAGVGVYITYIDKATSSTSESFTVIYNADRNLVVRVRDGGATPIKTFVTSATLSSAGGTSTAIRTSDS